MPKANITIEGYTNEDRTQVDFQFTSEDDVPLTAQDIIDAIGTYLLLDPLNIFTEAKTRDGVN